MNTWKYQIVSKTDSNEVLLEDSGFETESDAEEQGLMEAKVRNLRNWSVRTLQEWEEI